MKRKKEYFIVAVIIILAFLICWTYFPRTVQGEGTATTLEGNDYSSIQYELKYHRRLFHSSFYTGKIILNNVVYISEVERFPNMERDSFSKFSGVVGYFQEKLGKTLPTGCVFYQMSTDYKTSLFNSLSLISSVNGYKLQYYALVHNFESESEILFGPIEKRSAEEISELLFHLEEE